jgi:D-3-phosphoglycerate dehydrogenase
VTPGRVLVTTFPFGEIDRDPIEVLERERIPFTLNSFRRRYTEAEFLEAIGPYTALIAGTDPITEAVLDRAPNLRLIARSGIGLDSVALRAARARGIAVTYTPSAPSPAVAELTIGQMLALLRLTHTANREVRGGVWKRRIGRRLALMTVGVIGAGRIGRLVIRHLHDWGARVLAHDLVEDDDFAQETGCQWTNLSTIFREADIITVHVPLTPRTRGLIGKPELAAMKRDAILINTARGEIVDEPALAQALRERPMFSAALDVFEEEPYHGELLGLDNCIITSHMGSATRDCRLRMEVDAAREVVRFFKGEPLACPVPESEYAAEAENSALRPALTSHERD